MNQYMYIYTYIYIISQFPPNPKKTLCFFPISTIYSSIKASVAIEGPSKIALPRRSKCCSNS